MTTRPRVVILGGGIGGIKAAQQLANQPVDVLIIDHNNSAAAVSGSNVHALYR